jgi:son of sevenless-like protein
MELLRLIEQRLLCVGLSAADAFVVQVTHDFAPVALHAAELARCGAVAERAVQSRTMAMLKTWCQRFFVFGDFDDSSFAHAFFNLLSKFEGIAAMQRVAAALKSDLFSRLERCSCGVIAIAGSPPPIIYPHDKFTAYYKFDKSFRLQMWPTEEVARQFALYEFSIFSKIQPKELLNQAWSRNTRHELAPNVTAAISHFNAISSLVAYSIVSVPELQLRQRMCVLPPRPCCWRRA